MDRTLLHFNFLPLRLLLFSGLGGNKVPSIELFDTNYYGYYGSQGYELETHLGRTAV